MILTTALGGYALGANNMANVVGVFIDSCEFKPIKIGEIYFEQFYSNVSVYDSFP